jgi:hypothetical protein
VSTLDPAHLHLFKADWVSDPTLLEKSIKDAKFSDKFTAELAAWCVEIHEHLRDLQTGLGIELMLMGGNGASLRFEAAAQRGSRDNDYMTAADRKEIDKLMDAFRDRFSALPAPLMKPKLYEPKGAVRELPMVTYEVAVPFRLNHGNAKDSRVKVEFHFEEALPPGQEVVGVLGAAADPKMTAQLPALPYQVVIKQMTLARAPVGIEEPARMAAVPRQLYDIDGLAMKLSASDWTALVDYCEKRYAYECGLAGLPVEPGEPFDGVRERLLKWADCLDEGSDQWKTIRAVQTSQLRKPIHLVPRGWRARAYRLLVLSESIRQGAAGWDVWSTARKAADFIPDRKSKGFKPALADSPGRTRRTCRWSCTTSCGRRWPLTAATAAPFPSA